MQNEKCKLQNAKWKTGDHGDRMKTLSFCIFLFIIPILPRQQKATAYGRG
jgi:hypothetical protein